LTDFLGVALNGFSTGAGVICANEVYRWLKTMRLHRIPMDIAENLIEDVRDIGTKRPRK
jgi:hypothetical protein